MTEEEFNGESAADLRQKVSFLPDIHRLLPQSPDAEQGILCSLLLAPREVAGLCVEKGLTPDHFHVPAHGRIFETLIALMDEQRPPDIITLTERLRDRNLLYQCGGPAFVTQLFTFLPTAANAAFYLEIVQEKYTLREIIRVCTEYAARSYEEQHEVQTLLDEVEAKVLAIATSRLDRRKRKAMKELAIAAVGLIDRAMQSHGSISGLSTGFPDLDRMTDGLHGGDMIVIAARPSMGKTALAMNIVERLAIEEARPVAIYSLEMKAEQLTQRLVCSQARVNIFRLRDGFITERDYPAITAAAARISKAPIIIEDTSGMSIQEIRADARRLKERKAIEAIFVDYLQLACSTTKRSRENRQLEIGEISAGLKNLAKELDIPVVVLAQLNRSADSDGIPRLSDLRESGCIEQDADLVGFLVREEMVAKTAEARQEAEGKAMLYIRKQRSGPIADVPLTFLKEFTRFEPRARDFEREEEERQGDFDL